MVLGCDSQLRVLDLRSRFGSTGGPPLFLQTELRQLCEPMAPRCRQKQKLSLISIPCCPLSLPFVWANLRI